MLARAAMPLVIACAGLAVVGVLGWVVYNTGSNVGTQVAGFVARCDGGVGDYLLSLGRHVHGSVTSPDRCLH